MAVVEEVVDEVDKVQILTEVAAVAVHRGEDVAVAPEEGLLTEYELFYSVSNEICKKNLQIRGSHFAIIWLDLALACPPQTMHHN